MLAASGWVIANAVRTSQLNSQIQNIQTSLSSDEIKLIKNGEKIKDANAQDIEDNNSMDIVEEVITIKPLPLENPTEYQETSSFFDALCNFISGLFGG